MSWGCLTGLTYTIKLLQVQQEMQLSSACFWEGRLQQKEEECCGCTVPFVRSKRPLLQGRLCGCTLWQRQNWVKDASRFRLLILSLLKTIKKPWRIKHGVTRAAVCWEALQASRDPTDCTRELGSTVSNRSPAVFILTPARKMLSLL